jgi:hypothetical protein
MIHLPPCAICQASDVIQGRYEGSVILWFTCRHCGHIWCAPNPQPSDVVSRGMTEFAWRRLHGHDIVAEATIDGCGLWSAATSRQSNPTVIVRTAKQLHSWDAACAKADALARRTFEHICEMATCGDWLPIDLGWPNPQRPASPRARPRGRRRHGSNAVVLRFALCDTVQRIPENRAPIDRLRPIRTEDDPV